MDNTEKIDTLIKLVEKAMEFKPLLLHDPVWHLAATIAVISFKTPPEPVNTPDQNCATCNDTKMVQIAPHIRGMKVCPACSGR